MKIVRNCAFNERGDPTFSINLSNGDETLIVFSTESDYEAQRYENETRARLPSTIALESLSPCGGCVRRAGCRFRAL